jgi:biopolymer transport protein ExbD
MPTSAHTAQKQKPFINVTPLIDVLLVLLIIFMVVSPLKQARFTAQVPSPKPPDDPDVAPPPLGLVVTIGSDHSLALNGLPGLGTVDDTTKLSTKLTEVFAERLRNRAFSFAMMTRTDVPDALRVEKTVFIKAPRSMGYGDVVKVIDGIKVAGGAPIGLQLDDLN